MLDSGLFGRILDLVKEKLDDLDWELEVAQESGNETQEVEIRHKMAEITSRVNQALHSLAKAGDCEDWL